MEEHKILLAVAIIKEQFGPIVYEVSHYISKHENSTLISLAKVFNMKSKQESMKISTTQLRTTLLVLQQHNCLSITSEYSLLDNDEEDTSKDIDPNLVTLSYNLDYDNIINRLMFPKLLSFVHNQYGEVAVAIMEELLLHGKLRLNQILQDLVTEELDEAVVQQQMELLINKRFIVLAPTLDLKKKRETAGEVKEGKAAVAKRKREEIVDTELVVDNDLPVELRVMMQKEQQVNTTAPPPTKAARSGRGAGRSGRGGRGSKAKTSEITEEAVMSDSVAPVVQEKNVNNREDVLWIVGWSQLLIELKHELCVSIIGQRQGALAADIVKIILNRSMPTEGSNSQTQSASMGVFDIIRELKVVRKDGEVDNAVVRKVLELMKSDPLGMVTKVPGSSADDRGALYNVHMRNVCKYVQQSTIHAMACERFGLESGRIVRLLQKRKYLDQQNLSDLSILPAKDARERLYELYKFKWVDYIEICKRNDYNPASTYYYWFVDFKKIVTLLLEQQYQTIYNLKARRDVVFAGGKELLEFAHAIANPAEVKKFDVLTASLDALDCSTLKIMQHLLLLKDYPSR